MKSIHPDYAPGFAAAQGIATDLLLSNESVTFIHAALKPGQRLFKPTVLSELYFYVLKGGGVMEIGDERLPLSEGMLVQSPTRFPQTVCNDGSEPLELLACFPSPGHRAHTEADEIERERP